MTTHSVWTDRTFEPLAAGQPWAHVRPGWSTRLRARLLARRLDRRIDADADVRPGSVLAAHRYRLSTRRERTDLARSLTLVVRDAVEGPDVLNPRVAVRTPEVLRHRELIEDVRRRLAGPAPVRVRGMARLRLLLADGRGPLYRQNAGSLSAALRGVLAAL
ncbi:hypothetical protein [Mycolicibacterium arenosum]|uniref:Uncharacterized protein n=1 Tax=Mycolicibacterium arenosum TaxID=2952157 RepID=A0ABT1M7I3_9MYCO|nr:hypothetical protein [Mycolicibacterium sp. CAU 1645]MCP9275138.1 hypothetical protein [Mycolicibacterium sp. CAU 1645]